MSSSSTRYPQRYPANALQRPERRIKFSGLPEQVAHHLHGLGRHLLARPSYKHRRFIKTIHRYGERYQTMDEQKLVTTRQTLQKQLRQHGINRELLAEAFALVREVAGRQLGMFHFDVQLRGGLALIEGYVAEMQTGEGKTLTATLPAATAALAGIPVHIITVNDYLARRDSQTMAPVYQALGLSVGCITSQQSHSERRQAYKCDIVYCTNKDLVFDYLRDQLLLQGNNTSLHRHGERLKGERILDDQLLLRGLHFAIVDEADSILVDEARSPLVISGGNGEQGEQQVFVQALTLARSLVEGRDYQLNHRQQTIQLYAEGEQRIQEESRHCGGFWTGKVRRNDMVHKALTALTLLHRNEHYLIRDGRVELVDGNTGRIMADRTWEQGLQQLVEIKEGCATTTLRNTLARITYQRFFRQYLHLGGMSGTVREVRQELWQVYNLPSLTIPTHQPSRRINKRPRYFVSEQQQWRAVLDSILDKHRQGRAVLIGVTSIAAANQLSRQLHDAELTHQLLTAANDAEEAEIIARAGQHGQITIATQMAGRGTDIALSESVREAGGLHVIMTGYHDSARIDRQLAGRCARQGDPGSFEILVSGNIDTLPFIGETIRLLQLRFTQRQVERRHAKIRQQLSKTDRWQEDRLSFTNS